jgi:hypothetical protein
MQAGGAALSVGMHQQQGIWSVQQMLGSRFDESGIIAHALCCVLFAVQVC